METSSEEFAYRFVHKSLILQNRLTLKDVDRHGKAIRKELHRYPRNTLEIDLSEIKKMDSTGVAFLNQVRDELSSKNIETSLIGASAEINSIIQTFAVPEAQKSGKKSRGNIFERIGNEIFYFFQITFLRYIFLMADLFVWTFIDVFKRKSHRKGEFVNQATKIGVNALPIVGTISFLIGLVLALQSAAQLRQFGANVFIADLVVVAMTAEMGPLLTAIMIAGRSGSAIASEVATMTVTEEIDALKTMGLNPVRYILVPKLHASLFTMPFLTILADILGILGGMVVAYLYLDISLQVFYSRMVSVLYFKDIITGIIKSLVFGGIIVQTSAYFGLIVSGGAVGVGKYTTKAVVTSIFLVILADSVLGLLFY